MDIHITEDRAYATAVMTHPAIWPALTNDLAPPLPEFEAPEGFVYFVPVEDGRPAGLFGVRVAEIGVISLHVAMLPEFRGTGTRRAGQAMLDWIWTNTPAERVVVRLEARNVLARAAAVRAGFVQCDQWTDTITKAGEPMEMIEMEVRRVVSH